MTDLGLTTPRRLRLDRVWLAIALIFAAIILLTPEDLGTIGTHTLAALLHTAPYILFAVFAVAFMRATGSEALLARAFQGRESRMILMSALVGGVAPFCSCEVIPFVAALLAMGAPLSAAMAFWLASPLMDPAMFMITAGALGIPFALAKTAAAVGLGLFGGFAVMALAKTAAFADPLRTERKPSCGCSSSPDPSEKPHWAFWKEPARRAAFAEVGRENGLFLLKWLTLAYLLEGLMLRHVPAELIATALGGEGAGTILLATVLGGPAYLNGFAAVPLIGGLIDQGMSQGAAMAFVLAGGVTSIPAAMAVWALVKPRVFAGYIGFALVGAFAAGSLWSAIA
ncbi:MAG: permease [Pseudomonadota bacterium]